MGSVDNVRDDQAKTPLSTDATDDDGHQASWSSSSIAFRQASAAADAEQAAAVTAARAAEAAAALDPITDCAVVWVPVTETAYLRNDRARICASAWPVDQILTVPRSSVATDDNKKEDKPDQEPQIPSHEKEEHQQQHQDDGPSSTATTTTPTTTVDDVALAGFGIRSRIVDGRECVGMLSMNYAGITLAMLMDLEAVYDGAHVKRLGLICNKRLYSLEHDLRASLQAAAGIMTGSPFADGTGTTGTGPSPVSGSAAALGSAVSTGTVGGGGGGGGIAATAAATGATAGGVESRIDEFTGGGGGGLQTSLLHAAAGTGRVRPPKNPAKVAAVAAVAAAAAATSPPPSSSVSSMFSVSSSSSATASMALLSNGTGNVTLQQQQQQQQQQGGASILMSSSSSPMISLGSTGTTAAAPWDSPPSSSLTGGGSVDPFSPATVGGSTPTPAQSLQDACLILREDLIDRTQHTGSLDRWDSFVDDATRAHGTFLQEPLAQTVITRSFYGGTFSARVDGRELHYQQRSANSASHDRFMRGVEAAAARAVQTSGLKTLPNDVRRKIQAELQAENLKVK